jgi:type II secretory pathway predicted ATPase ExeA
MDSYTPVSLVLSGQPELRERLKSNIFTAIRQRVSIVCSLKPLDRVQAGKYVEAHLNYSGYKDVNGLFSPEALDVAHGWSSGVPRLINKVCTQALVRAAGLECSHVNAQMMDDVIKTELL